MNKKHIICINGTLCTADLWQHQVSCLADTHTFSIPHIMGFDTISAVADKILHQAPHTFAIAGMSAGVPIALEIVRQLVQQNQLNRLEKIILIAGNPHGISAEKCQRFERQKQFVQQQGLKNYAQSILIKYVAPQNQKNTAITDKIIKMALHFSPDEFTLHTDMLKSRPCSLDTLTHIDCPLLAISGTEDTLCESSLHDIMATLAKNGTHIALKNTGHYINLENPQALNTHMQAFLNT